MRHAHARARDLADRRPVQHAEDLAVRHLEAPPRGVDGEAPRVVGVEEQAAELDPVKGGRLELARGVPLGLHPHAAHLEVRRVAAGQQQGAPQLERRVEALEEGPARRRPRARGRRRDQDPQVPDRRAALDELEQVRPRLRSERLVAEEALRVRAHLEVGLRSEDRGPRARAAERPPEVPHAQDPRLEHAGAEAHGAGPRLTRAGLECRLQRRGVVAPARRQAGAGLGHGGHGSARDGQSRQPRQGHGGRRLRDSLHGTLFG